MGNKIKCGLCDHEAYDLTSHIINFHKITTAEYKNKYGLLVSPQVEEKRRRTCLLRYSDENYKNREAIRLSNELFEGGHSLKDPTVRDKAKSTKEKIYGDPTFTNRDKAKKTNLKKYGVEYTCAAPLVIEKRIKTLKERYGKVFNVSEPHNKTSIPDTFKEDYYRGMTMFELGVKYGVSEPVISRWVKDRGFKRVSVNKAIKNVQAPAEVVFEYFKECSAQGRVLSFYEYGKIRGSNFTLKMKRLFNTGKKFSHLKETLFIVALDANRYNEFLDSLL